MSKDINKDIICKDCLLLNKCPSSVVPSSIECDCYFIDNYCQPETTPELMDKKIQLEGVGPDTEIVTNEAGGKQSKSPMALHLVDPEVISQLTKKDSFSCADEVISDIMTGCQLDNINFFLTAIRHIYKKNYVHDAETKIGTEALFKIAKVMQEGASKYKPNNWRLIPQEEHINHALIHYLAYQVGDRQDNHIDHCMARLMMAYATKRSPGFSYNKYIGD